MKNNRNYTYLRILISLFIFFNVIHVSHACSLQRLCTILLPEKQHIFSLTSIWEGGRKNLFDENNRWVGKMACGKATAICQFILAQSGIESQITVVEHPESEHGEDHAYLTVKSSQGTSFIIDPTYRQFLNHTDDRCDILIIESFNLDTFFKSHHIPQKDRWWLVHSTFLAFACRQDYVYHFYTPKHTLASLLKKTNPTCPHFISFKKAFKEHYIDTDKQALSCP